MYLRNLVCMVGVATALGACGKSEPKSEALPSAGQVVAAVASSTSTAAPSDMGIAIYPSAETLMASHLLASDSGASMYDSAFKSTDKIEKVAGFYREELAKMSGDKAKVVELPMGEGFVHLIGGKDESKVFDITIHTEGAEVLFSIKTTVKAK